MSAQYSEKVLSMETLVKKNDTPDLNNYTLKSKQFAQKGTHMSSMIKSG